MTVEAPGFRIYLSMEIMIAEATDFDTIFDLYDKAIEFQKQVFDKHWLGFDAELVRREIAENRLWKIIEGGNVACIFSVAYEDPVIWGETSGDDAMYIHRIVTNPDFRGRAYVRAIVEWARGHAYENALLYIRMDTWGDNLKLKEYYTACGFEYKGVVWPAESEDLPKHYSGINLGLFEIDLTKESSEDTHSGIPS